VSKRISNAKTEVTSICIHKARANAAIPTMSMNELQPYFAHFPGLLYDFIEQSCFKNLGRVVSVEVNFEISHLRMGSAELKYNGL
jgi:hypothetical protein